MKTLFAIAFIFMLGLPPAHAYIPRTETIVKKMTANNGKKDYKIVRDVAIEADNQQIKARETWTIKNGDNMRVKVESLDKNNPWSFAIIYGKNSRQTLSSQNQVKTYPHSKEFFESLFHDRYHRSLMSRLVGHRFVPDWIKDSEPTQVTEDGEIKIQAEPFVRLEPVDGQITYSLGASRSSSGESAQTQLWVEQDSFLIKKARLASGAEVVNGSYQTFAGGLQLPSEQRVSWDNKVARIQLVSAEPTQVDKKSWGLDRNNNLGSIPTDPLVKEFYSRFR